MTTAITPRRITAATVVAGRQASPSVASGTADTVTTGAAIVTIAAVIVGVPTTGMVTTEGTIVRFGRTITEAGIGMAGTVAITTTAIECPASGSSVVVRRGESS